MSDLTTVFLDTGKAVYAPEVFCSSEGVAVSLKDTSALSTAKVAHAPALDTYGVYGLILIILLVLRYQASAGEIREVNEEE